MAEEKTMENSLGATGNFIHNYIQETLKGQLNNFHTRFRRNPMAICTLVTQNPFA